MNFILRIVFLAVTYDQAIVLDATLAFVFNNRGVTRKKLGDVKGALADYTQAIKLRPNFGLAYLNRRAMALK